MFANSTALPASAQAFSAAEPPNFSTKSQKNGSERPQPRSDWVDYGEAEPALFDAMKPEIRLLALDVARLGLELDAAIREVVDAAWPKALAFLRAAGTAQVFSDEKLEARLRKWAEFWCAKCQKRPHTKYTPEAAKRGGETRGKQREAEANRRAYFAQDWKAKGWSMERIAQKLGAGISTVYRLLKRTVPQWFGLSGKVVSSKFSQGKDSKPSTIQLWEGKDHLPCEKAKPPPPKARDMDNFDIIGGLLAHWGMPEVSP